jgi:DNA invertase Pin-like site-specific DNA recombinase
MRHLSFSELEALLFGTENVPVTGFSYKRFSSPQQAEGDSERRQTDLRDSWLGRHPHVRLDTTLRMTDRGLSGYYGVHRKKGALGKFLALVEAGRIPAGSLLLVENIDRLGREAPIKSLTSIICKLWEHGIVLVTLAPEEYYEPGCDTEPKFLLLTFHLQRAYEESKRKSELLTEVFADKKVEARNGKVPHGAALPAWLEVVGVKPGRGNRKDFSEARYRIREDAGAAVRRVFELSRAGCGTLAIAAKLNEDKVPPIARNTKWIRSYVAKILNNPAVLGEYQPMKGHHGRTKDGEAIPGYFPAVVTPELWHAAHRAKDGRNKRAGRPGRKGDYQHVFAGLLRSADDRCAMHVITRKGRRFLLSAAAAQGEKGAAWRPFPLEPFVAGLLGELEELKSADLFRDPGAVKVRELEGRLRQVERRLTAALKHFDADPDSEEWAGQVSKYGREKRELARELAEARRAAANPLSGVWEEAVELMKATEPGRLHQALLETVREIQVVIVPHLKDRLARVDVYFAGEGTQPSHRSYLLVYRPAVTGAAGHRPARLFVDSVLHLTAPLPVEVLVQLWRQANNLTCAAHGTGKGKAEADAEVKADGGTDTREPAWSVFNNLDLRQPADAATVRAALEALPASTIDELLAERGADLAG